ncbi:MAG: 1,4-dihydroxy-6-naphthoate synthase [Bacteroidetes bacterium]|nr:1,4-dihydroxy-6-naphthoate synthase [Bacteroidota bacterium]
MKNKILTLGFSPCPNDCFIFDALLHGKIDTEGLQFKPVMEDVEALNRRAVEVPSSKFQVPSLDITKLSFFAYSKLQKKYSLLDSGSALGFGTGPVLVIKPGTTVRTMLLGTTAIPGENTTANFLLSFLFPVFKRKKVFHFSKIIDAVVKEKVSAGVVIHESRFTYEKKGLVCYTDLGGVWEAQTHLPIALGGIFIKKTFPKEIQKKVERVIRRSVEFAFANPYSSKAFVKKHSQEMDDKVIKQHIGLYVNDFSISLGRTGRKAISKFLECAKTISVNN